MPEALVILLLILTNGLLAGTEIAVLSARRPLLHTQARSGEVRARRVLSLLDDPNNFLSTIQIGITLVGILAGAFGGADAVRYLAPLLSRLPIPLVVAYAEPLALGLVVLIIAYLTLVIGELVPKRLGLHRPEAISMAMARPMIRLASVARPVVWLLSRSTEMVLRALGVPSPHPPAVTEDEVRYLVREGARTGVFVPAEKEFVEGIFRLGDESVADVMRPRPDVVALDIDEPAESVRLKVLNSTYSRFPVYRGDLSQILGIVHARDVLGQEGPIQLEPILRQALFVPESKSLLSTLRAFQDTHSQMAVVINEFGGIEGVVTLEDVLEEIVGEIRDEYDVEEPAVFSREDGSLLVDGSLSIPDLKEALELHALEGEESREFHTLGGLLMAYLRRVPREGDEITISGFRFEVLDMDGLRVDKVLVRREEEQ